MKNIKLLALIPLMTVTCLTGCNKNEEPVNNDRPYQENFIYDEAPIYEPIDLDVGDKQLDKVEFIGFPYNKQIKAAAFDETDAAIRAWYMDGTVHSTPLKIKNIPLEYRHYFGEIGEHSISMQFKGKKETLSFTIVENPDFKGYKCYFYDRNKKLVDTQTVGYYQTVTYQGTPLPEVEEDGDYRYTLEGWDHNTTYIHQDMQFLAKYKMLEKRWYAHRINNWDHICLSGLVNQEKTEGSAIMFIGRVTRVPVYYGPTVELDNEDIELVIEPGNYSKYWSDLNQTIVSELVEYKVDPDYNSKLYGNVSEIVTHPNFASYLNKDYDFKGVKEYLEGNEEIVLSTLDPFDDTVTQIGYAFNHLRPVITKDSERGYYRAAIVGSFDVYVEISFKKLKDKVYEVGNYNQFVISPVRDTFKMVEQHSYDGNFGPNFDTKLTVSTKAIYNLGDMIDWSRW